MLTSLRWGVSRGIFSNEAGLGAAGITAAAADTEDCVRQGYISMTGVFLDTVVMCSLTGLALAVSGVLREYSGGETAENGTALILAVFQTTFDEKADGFVSISIALFAFATIVGWAYQGETALVYLAGCRTVPLYRCLFGAAAWAGAFLDVEAAFGLSDLFNSLMALPNLACLLLLSGAAAREMKAFQPELHREKRRKPVNFL